VVALFTLLQLAAPASPSLAAARHALHAADTSAAVATLMARVTPDTTYTAEETTALILLHWISRGPARDSLNDIWDRGLRAARRRPGGTWRLAHEVPFALSELNDGNGDREISEALGGSQSLKSRPWQTRLREAALGERDSLLMGVARWVAAVGWLADIDRFASDVPTVIPPAGCSTGCLVRRLPPAALPLLRRIQVTGRDAADPDEAWHEWNPAPAVGRTAAWDSLWVALEDTRSGPWPFDELAERLRVTVCALLRLADASGECTPDTRGFDSVVVAELQVVHHEFDGHRGLAARAMDAAPARFAALDQAVGVLLASPGAAAGPRFGTRGGGRGPARDGAASAPAAPPGFWRTAWPLYLMPYNERLIAHRARLLLADMSRRFATHDAAEDLFGAYGEPSMLVRIGVPLALAHPEGGSKTALITYAPLGTHETIVRRGRGMEGVSLDLALAARSDVNPMAVSGFTGEDYDSFGPLDHQVVQYTREGREHVEIYTRWEPSPGCEEPRPLLGFFLFDARLRQLSKAIDVNPMNPPRLKRFHIELAPGSYVYSLEMLDRSCRTAERSRYVLTVPPVEERRVSDLMFADELYFGDERWTARIKDRPPVTVRPSLTLNAGSIARFYWELYGIAADSMEAGRLRVTFEVINVRDERVVVRELGDVAEQARRRAGTLDVHYDLTVPAGDGPLGFGLAVGIPEGTRGVHVARVRITDTRTQKTVTTERAFFVRD
jgi:hypothetical protein